MRTLTVAACAGLFLAMAWPGAAGAAPAPIERGGVTVTETTLPERDLFPGSIVEGPDGNMWFAVTKADPGRTLGDPVGVEAAIARMTPDGQLVEFPLPAPDSATASFGSGAGRLVSGPGDAIWFLREDAVGRIAMSGQVTEYPVGGDARRGLAVGAEGNLWFVRSDKTGIGTSSESLVRMTPGGVVSEFPLNGEPLTGDLATGPDGNLWFTETFGKKIGRVTPAGQISEFPLDTVPGYSIAGGPDDNLWFVVGGDVGRITPAGVVLRSFVAGTVGEPLLNGPDGRFWFKSGSAALGRLTVDGRPSEIALRSAQRDLLDIAPGPDGEVWFTAEGQPPCEGGGGSCFATTYSAPGVIGRVSIDPLSAVVHAYRNGVKHRGATLSIACRGGDADGVCHGTVRISVKRSGRVLVHRRYGLKTDQGRTVVLPFGRRRGRRVSLPSGTRLIATVSVRGGDATRRGIVVR